jgi:hypothetical protein
MRRRIAAAVAAMMADEEIPAAAAFALTPPVEAPAVGGADPCMYRD